MTDALAKADFNPDRFERLKEKLYTYNGIDYTRKRAADHVTRAKACLDEFEDNESRRLLTLIADYSIERKV
jgi:octaprenyl-diphosphate synthase